MVRRDPGPGSCGPTGTSRPACRSRSLTVVHWARAWRRWLGEQPGAGGAPRPAESIGLVAVAAGCARARLGRGGRRWWHPAAGGDEPDPADALAVCIAGGRVAREVVERVSVVGHLGLAVWALHGCEPPCGDPLSGNRL